MRTPENTITIVIPTYRRAKLLAKALSSAINQTVSAKDYKILVVDNDPENDTETERLVKENARTNLRYFKNETNLGGYGNWNQGIRLADTEWVCLLHDDDLLLPTCIENAYSILMEFETPRLGAVLPRQCNLYDSSEEERLEQEERNRNWKARLDQRLKNGTHRRMWKASLFDNYLVFSTYPAISGGNLLRRSAVLALGGFGNTWPCEDIFFLNRLSQTYDCFLIGQQWGWYRFGTNNRWAEPGELVRNDYAKKLFRENAAIYDRRCARYHRIFGDAMCLLDREGSIRFAKKRGKTVDPLLYTWVENTNVSAFRKRLCRVNINIWRILISLRAILFGYRVGRAKN